LYVQALATEADVAIAYIATNIYGCNTLLQRDFLQSLATNVIWLQYLPFATKLGLLQRFLVVTQELEVSSDIN
jgi:hypothetical protein